MVTTPYDELTRDQVVRAIEYGEDNPRADTYYLKDVKYYRLFAERYRDTAQACLVEIRNYGFKAIKVRDATIFGDKVWIIYVARKG